MEAAAALSSPNPENKLFVGGAPPGTDEQTLQQIFAEHGEVEEVFVMRGGSRSGQACAFVRFTTAEGAVAAIQAIHGKYIMPGCTDPLVVRYADAPGSRAKKGGGGRGFNGGYGPPGYGQGGGFNNMGPGWGYGGGGGYGGPMGGGPYPGFMGANMGMGGGFPGGNLLGNNMMGGGLGAMGMAGTLTRLLTCTTQHLAHARLLSLCFATSILTSHTLSPLRAPLSLPSTTTQAWAPWAA